jgi:mRNA interferase MazF
MTIIKMDHLSFGDIVLLRFPFTDGQTFKRRPALVINDSDDGDVIVCRITSQIYSTKYDVYIDNWEKAGLKLPSVIRIHKIATLEKDMTELVIGQIENSIKTKVKSIFETLTQ